MYPLKSNDDQVSINSETITPSHEINLGNLRRLMFVENEKDYLENAERAFDYEEASEEVHVRQRRNAKLPYPSSALSPLPVTYAINYNEKENKGWVKPLFSSIVYRLSVSI